MRNIKTRRQVLKAAAAAVALPALARPGFAQTYPSRPIRMNVGFPPGGAADIVARWSVRGLSVRLGQPVVIENRPGSGANVAGEATARAAPDGYTIMHGPDNLFMANPHLYAKMAFDPLKDLVPIASLTSNQLLLAVHPSVQANSLREFVELARRTKPPLFYASIGGASTTGDGNSEQHVDRSHPCAVSRRSGRHRASCRRGVGDARRRLAGADDSIRQGPGLAPRRHALSADAGASDHRRDLSRLRGADLAWSVRAGGVRNRSWIGCAPGHRSAQAAGRDRAACGLGIGEPISPRGRVRHASAATTRNMAR